MSESLSHQMHAQTLQSIVDRYQLNEVLGDDGGPFLPLISQVPMAQGQVGEVRVFRGAPLTQLVTCSIVVPAIGLDSHMLFAFTDTEGGVPHFTVDSVQTGEIYAFHLDLIPRVDLAVSLPYMDEVYSPLTEVFNKHQKQPGLTQAQLDPRQLAVMSPWMLVNRADETAFRATFDSVEAYLQHWFALMDSGVSAEALADSSADSRATRDLSHRRIIFNPAVDKVWNQITPLIGAEAVTKIIDQLCAHRG